MSIQIIEASDGPGIDKVEQTVKAIFPSMDFVERWCFWAYRRRGNPCVRVLMRLGGISSLINLWVAVDETGAVCGTTGLYTTPQDEHEAAWLSWFCVDPKHRGQGIGKLLIEFSIEEARAANKKFLRLYTSDDENEAAA